MRRIMRVITSSRHKLAALLAVTALAAALPVALGSIASAAQDYSGNANIRGGFTTAADFVNKLNGSSSLQALYKYNFGISGYGLNAGDYKDFVSHAVEGTTDRSGNIIVNGKTVATGAKSIGRYESAQGSDPSKYVIPAAGTFWGNTNNKNFASGTNSVKIYALFDKSNGKLKFAVMPSCGNQSFGSIKSAPTCDHISAKQSGSNKNNFDFTTSVTAGDNGETIDHVVYHFGDGSTASSNKAPYKVSHAFTKNATVTTTVYVNVPGYGVIAVSDCSKSITFTPPPAVVSCYALTPQPGKYDDQGYQLYGFTASATADNATIESYTFTWGDESSTVVHTSAGKTQNVLHSYAPGNYTAKVLVTFVADAGGTKTAGNSGHCATPIAVAPLATSLTCVSLDAVAGTPDATSGATVYTLTVTAKPTNAKVSSYVFDLDGSSKTVVTNSNTATITQPYAPGDWNVSVSVKGKDIYGNPLTAPVGNCKAAFTVKVPECKPGVPVGSPQCFPSKLTCVNLTATPGAVDAAGNQTYTFAAQGSVDNGLITGYSFAFDNNGNAGVTPYVVSTGASKVTGITHVYAPGNHLASVEVTGTDASGNKIIASGPNCLTPIAVKELPANVSITKTVDNLKSEVVAVNQRFTYRLVVENTGQVLLTNVSVTDATPNGVTLVTADSGTINNNVWSAIIPSLEPGDKATFNIVATTTAYTSGSLTNQACVNAPQVNTTAPNASDDCDTATVTLMPPTPVTPTTPVPPAPTTPALPNTGAGDVIGIMAGVAVVGFALYQLVFRRRIMVGSHGAFMHHVDEPADSDAHPDLTSQVIARQQHQQHQQQHARHPNTQGLYHASYTKPHRFRPRSHHDE